MNADNRRTIRAAVDTDQPAIAAINRAAYESFRNRFGSPTLPKNDTVPGYTPADLTFVVDEDAMVVGLLVLTRNADHMYLDNIAVVPTHQKHGIGRELLAFAERETISAGYRELRLFTSAFTPETFRLYEKTGYREMHRRYTGQYEWIFMRKPLALDNTADPRQK